MLLLFNIILLLRLHPAVAASGVLGIDLGTEYLKAALVKPGIPLEIVLTKDSKRKEAAAVAFKPASDASAAASSHTGIFAERAYGGDALALAARYPGDVFANLKPLLGRRSVADEEVMAFGAMYPGVRIVGVGAGAESGRVGIKSETFEREEEPFLIEELLAMELQNIKANAEAFAGKGVGIRDVVFSVPSFWTVEERRALTTAAELAGLRVLAMASDGLSVGLNYATSRTFASISEGAEPEHHLIYDMGAGSTTATILRFQGRTVKDVGRFNKTIQEMQVMGVGWDTTLGGDALNGLIVNDMIAQFTNLPKMKALGVEPIHIKTQGRTFAKLRKEAERLRQVLSANTETQASFEGLHYEDVNFKYKLSRASFEKMSADFAARVKAPVTEALAMAGLQLSDIESVILHGGVVRTPFVQKQLESIVKSAEKIRTNVNSDEAAVFGAAFKAAGLSPSFRVKEIRVADVAGYAVGLSWQVDGKQKDQRLFKRSSQVGLEKQVPFPATTDFSFSLYQASNVKADPTLPVANIQTQNLTASSRELTDKFGCSMAEIKTSFSIRLSPVDGLPEVMHGTVSCEVDDSVKKGSVVDGMKGLFGFGSKKSEQAPIQEDSTIESSTSDSTTSTSTSATAKSSGTKKSAEKAKEVKKQLRTINISFAVEALGTPSLSGLELERVKTRMAAFDASDRSRKAREEALNSLEAYTYKTRDLVDDDEFVRASSAEQRAAIEAKSKLASEWLYGDGAEASKDDLKARFDELRDLVHPIQRRLDEARKRPDLVQSLRDTLDQTEAMMEVVKQSTEKAAIAAAAAEAAKAASSSESASPSTSSSAPPANASDEAPSSPSTSGTSTSSSSTSTSALPILEMPTYSTEDLADLSTAYESIKAWLDDTMAAQDKLSFAEEPVLLASDIAAKSKFLNQAVMGMIQRRMTPETPPPPPPKMKMKTSSSKSSKPQSKSQTSSRTKAAKKAKSTATLVEVGEEQEDKVEEEGGDRGETERKPEQEQEHALPVDEQNDARNEAQTGHAKAKEATSAQDRSAAAAAAAVAAAVAGDAIRDEL